MWRHYLSTAVRGIVQHRLYSIINIVVITSNFAWAMVFGNTLRLARANPVRALRYE